MMRYPSGLRQQPFRVPPRSGILQSAGPPGGAGPSLAMDLAEERPTDVARAAERLGRPRARAGLVVKRGLDVVLAIVMVVAMLPLFVILAILLVSREGDWLERRTRLGRDGRPLRLARFRPLPGGLLGRTLERAGARELPVLFAVLGGRLSFVGPRALAPGTGAGHTGPRRLMAPGLIGPAQRWATNTETASELDDAYVERWSLRGDLRMLLCTRCRPPAAVRIH
jgi:lipopolysaccharide/colanic/teichoic acid biosynthesis glycosyltransferase